jgi:DNA repair protein RadC
MNAKLFELKKIATKFPCEKIVSSESAYNFIKQFYSDDIEIYESFFILLVNRANKTIGYAKISQGGIVGTVVDVKIIAKYAVESLASGIILAHNHPSGALYPSAEDKACTKKIVSALQFLDVTVLDHIIVTNEGYYSLQDNGDY